MRKLLIVLGIIAVASGLSACSKEGPATKAARELAVKLNDVRQARDIVDSSVARRVNCALAATHAFSRQTGNAQIWIYRREEDNILECFDTEGHHPTRRSALLEVTSGEVAEIMADPTTYNPRPIPRPPVVVATPTPQPLLDCVANSQAPCQELNPQVILRLKLSASCEGCDDGWSPPRTRE